MANVIIHNDDRKSQTNQTLRDYGIDPSRATKEQRDMADCIACKSNEAIKELRRQTA